MKAERHATVVGLERFRNTAVIELKWVGQGRVEDFDLRSLASDRLIMVAGTNPDGESGFCIPWGLSRTVKEGTVVRFGDLTPPKQGDSHPEFHYQEVRRKHSE